MSGSYTLSGNSSRLGAYSYRVETLRPVVTNGSGSFVSDGLLSRLDGLEGHPAWYRRRQIPIVLDGTGELCDAWVYLMPDKSVRNGVYHRTY